MFIYFLFLPPLSRLSATPLLLGVSANLPTTCWRLGAGGASTAAWTGAKLENLHKLSSELLPRLRQTARCAIARLYNCLFFYIIILYFFYISCNTKSAISFALVVTIIFAPMLFNPLYLSASCGFLF